MTLAASPSELEGSLPYVQAPRSRAEGLVAAIAWTITLAAVLVAYGLFLSLYYAPAIIHPDANGYWAQGSLIWQTGHTWFKPESDAQYIGMHWLLLGDNTFISRYPPGFPLIVGLVQTLFGWKASVLVNPVLAVLTLIGAYLTLKRLASPAWGILGVIALAANPAFTVHALTQISHMAVAFSVVWGVYLLIRWSDEQRVRDIFLAGLVLGCIPSTRYADAVVAMGVGVFMLWHVGRIPKIHKHFGWAIAGAMIPILPLLVRNQLLFGAFWKTGYALTNEQTGFSRENFYNHAIPYLQMLQSGGLGMMFALGFIGMLWMLFVPRTRAIAAMLLTATAPFLAVYMAYYWAMGVGAGGMGGNVGGAMRFLVPIVPLFVIAGVWGLSQALVTTPRLAQVAIPLAVVAMQVLMYGSSLQQELRQSFDGKSVLALATQELDAVAPAGSVVVGDQSVLQQLDFVRKWKLADASLVGSRGMRGPGGGGGPGGGQGRGAFNRQGGGGPGGGMPGMGMDGDAPSPQQQAKNEARAKLYPGTQTQKEDKFASDVLTWAGNQPIYVVGKEADLVTLVPGALKSEFAIVKRLSTPRPPEEPTTRNSMSRMGGFGGGPGGPGGRNGGMRRGGGPFGSFAQPGEEFVIAKWNPPA